MKSSAEIKKAYTEILKACEKHLDWCDEPFSKFRDIKTMHDSAMNHLQIIEWGEKYGIDISHDKKMYQHNYIDVDGSWGYRSFSYFRDAMAEKESGSGRYISWSDDGRQPCDEWLLKISSPTGGCIFGDDYEGQKQLFQDFFDELKSHKPDYTDTANHCLYWKIENASEVYNKFDAILKKYKVRNKDELKSRKAQALRDELAKLDADEQA